MKSEELKTINCDQIAWLGNALDRYAKVMAVTLDFPRASYVAESAKTATILEIMDYLHMYFEDESARHNMAVNLHCRPIAADLRLAVDQPTNNSDIDKTGFLGSNQLR